MPANCCLKSRRPNGDSLATEVYHHLISDSLPFDQLWYGGPNAAAKAIDYAKFYSRSHAAVIRVYDDAGNVIETHEHKGEFKEP